MHHVLGALFAILVGMLSIPPLLNWQNQAKNNVNAAQVAAQARQIVLASRQYIQTNAVALQASATTSVPTSITIAQLQAAQLLPASFKPTNLYNQAWRLEVLQPSAGSLQGLVVTTGGVALSDLHAMQIARLTGYEGGFFPRNDTGLYPGGANNAHGVNWGPLPAAGYTREAGRLALLIDFTQGQLDDPRLYRNEVPLQPQLNVMTTPIVMDAVKTINTSCPRIAAIARDSEGRIVSCQFDGQWRRTGDWRWESPVATYGNLPSDLVGTVRMTLDTARGYMRTSTGWRALAVDQNGDLAVPRNLTVGGTANFNGTVNMNGDVNLGDAGSDTVRLYATATEGDPCPARGIAYAADGTSLLICQSGIWAKAQAGMQSILYLEDSVPVYQTCPIGWLDVGYTQPAAGNFRNYRRACTSSSATPVLYLEDLQSDSVPSCPIGWQEYFWSRPLGGLYWSYRRTCLKV